MRCEDVECTLLGLIEGELPAVQRTEVLGHLDGCTACTADLSAYRALLARVEVDSVPEPSPRYWEEFLPSLKRRIRQEAYERTPTPGSRWTHAGSWLTFRPRLIAGLAVAAVSLFVVVRLPGLLPGGVSFQRTPVATEKVAGEHGKRYTGAMAPHPNGGNQQSGEPLMVAGEVVDEPSVLVAALQRLGWADEVGDQLETAWILRPESDPADSFASLDEKERQLLLEHLNQLQWSES
ncbi:MAG: hypothetical protein C3F12_13170 [Candidatus Methylomirabilota bacterium]|nr:zinc-finger domain-containing protein [Candidatus Methylomirabilis sp.]NJD68414.1 hypothetical protein [candidate division NC10 bacterium]PWB42863.1 MAG: hypothetical protein C3F12_13170 [candidate division NC10 bacterium]